MTRRTARSGPSSTRSARWPTAIRPRSAIPSRASGLRLAAATAAGSGSAGPDDVGDRRVERQHGPGQCPRPRQGHALPRDHDLEAAEASAAVAHPGQRDGVADEQQPVHRLQVRDERPQPRIDVDAVRDQLDEHRVVEQGGDGHARRMMVDTRHRVEQVGRGAGARRVAGPRLLEGRARMADRGHHATVRQPSDEIRGARQLRCDRHQPESVEERLERRGRDVGRDLQVGRVVSAATGSGEERSLQVEAERPGAVGGGVRRPVANGSREVDERR